MRQEKIRPFKSGAITNYERSNRIKHEPTTPPAPTTSNQQPETSNQPRFKVVFQVGDHANAESPRGSRST